MEGTVAVVGAGFEEVGQNVVGIACDNQPAYRKPDAFCKIAGQNIAEVAGRHHEGNLFAHLDLSLLYQGEIGGVIIDDLRDQAADIN